MSVLPEIQFSKVSVCKYDDGKATHIIKHEVIPHHINDVLTVETLQNSYQIDT